MKELRMRIKIKKHIFKTYKHLLGDLTDIFIPETNLKQTTPWFMDFITKNRDKLEKFLFKKGIKSRSFYPTIHSQMPYSMISKIDEFKGYNSNYVSDNGLHPPSGFLLSDDEIDYICMNIRSFINERN